MIVPALQLFTFCSLPITMALRGECRKGDVLYAYTVGGTFILTCIWGRARLERVSLITTLIILWTMCTFISALRNLIIEIKKLEK